MIKRAIRGVARAVVPARFRPRVQRMLTRVRYIGWRYRCPFCNAGLRRFRPFGLDFPVLKEKRIVGGGRRLNAQCPNCGSLDRERLLYLFLLHKTDLLSRPQRLLHVAPEPRLAAKLKAIAGLDYLTADIAMPDVMVRMDLTDIQFPDRSFDAIICNHVLEHIEDDARAMSELHRTLKTGGWAILQVPISLTLQTTYEDFSITDATAREQAFGQEDHVRIYGQDYGERLTRAGFTVHVFDWVSEAARFGGSRNVFGLNEEECVYWVSRS
jgi:SAM-dependent methyltransferase